MSFNNNNNFILSNDQSNPSDNSVDINSVKVSGGKLVDSITNEEVDTDTPISINDKKGLDKLSTLVNDNGFDFSNYIVILTNNILSTSTPQQPFTPIGNNTHKFNGTFDGQGHTISNLHVIAYYAGLFGYLDSNATVKNVGISADSSIGSSESRHAGGIAGQNYGTISNCYNTGTVTSTLYAGGIAGKNDNNGTIKNCYNTGTVKSNFNSGGITGDNYEGTISNCYNTGNVISFDKYGVCAGGIAGSNGGTISNCYNTGNVTAKHTDGSVYAGGIAGSNGGTISNCYNTGNVTAESTNGSAISGGIAGKNDNNGTISNCYNTGTVEGGTKGGIVGNDTNQDVTQISQLFYLKDCVDGDVGPGIGLESHQMGGDNLLGWDNNLNKYTRPNGNDLMDQDPKPWSPDIFNVNKGYPVLAYVPTQISTSNTLQSAVYITVLDESNQADNYLKPVNTSNPVKATVNLQGNQSGSFTYQWYLMNADGNKTDPFVIDQTSSYNLIHGTYFVKITKDGYSYTSLTRTVINSNVPSYNVTFDSEVGFDKDLPAETVPYGSTIAEPTPDPTKTGYSFKEWYADRSDESGEPTKISWDFKNYFVARDITLNADWTANSYSVIFNANGGTGNMESQPFTYDAAQNLKENTFTKTECKFLGWSKTSGGTVEYGDRANVNNLTPIDNGTVKLYAVWEINQYTIAFNSNDGSEVGSITADYNTAVSKPADPTKTGYTFAGWYSDEELTTEYNFTTMPAENIELYANWTLDTYTISFNLNGGLGPGGSDSIGSVTYTVNTKSITLDTPTKVGYTFKGWYENNTKFEYIPGQTVGDHSLTAEWTAEKYAVRYMDGDSEITAGSEWPMTYTSESETPLPTSATKKGYEFNGWYDTENLSGDAVTSIPAQSTGNKTFYAKFTPITYTVSFDANGGTGSMESQTFTYDAAQELIKNTFTKSGYRFIGWSESSTAATVNYTDCQKVTNLTETANETVILYAVWSPPPEPIYSLCLHSNDSDNLTKRYSGTYATKITLPSVESINWNNNNNCIFIEWNSKADGSGESFKAGDKLSLGSEIWNLYAVWSDSSVHSVSFNSNGGSSTPDQKVTDGYRASQPETPAKEGHTFKYWSLNGEKYDFNKSVREDITLKAEYEVNQYKVSFYYKGELLTTKTADFNTSLEDRMPALPSGTNEWNSNENGKGDKFTSDSLITKDSSVYAVSSSHSFNSALIIGGISAIALLALLAAWLYYTRSKNQ